MKINLEEIREKVKKYDYSLCIWTDRTDFLKDKSLPDEDKLLEIRCFKENGEFHAFRSTVDKEDFIGREIINDNCGDGSLEAEEYYLDIDTTKAKEDGKVFATGGGSYYLPVKNAEKIIVKYYYTFDDNGIARKTDWRIVGFKAKEGK